MRQGLSPKRKGVVRTLERRHPELGSGLALSPKPCLCTAGQLSLADDRRLRLWRPYTCAKAAGVALADSSNRSSNSSPSRDCAAAMAAMTDVAAAAAVEGVQVGGRGEAL